VLVLSRKQGEAIVIDGGIRITVVAVQGKAVRLGIEAPRSTSVDREKIAIRMARDGFRDWRPDEPSGTDELDEAVEFPGLARMPQRRVSKHVSTGSVATSLVAAAAESNGCGDPADRHESAPGVGGLLCGRALCQIPVRRREQRRHFCR
jgi:carbon storage regulator